MYNILKLHADDQCIYWVISSDSSEAYQTHQETLHQSTPHPPCRCKQWRPSSLVVSVLRFWLVLIWVMPYTRAWPFKLDSEALYSPHFWHVRHISTDCTDGQYAWTGSLLENEEAHRISLPVPGRDKRTLSQSHSLVQELSHLQVFAVVE